MAKQLERRRNERYEVNAAFAELEPGTFAFVSNLSEQGVFINTRQRLPVGTVVDLRFTILLDDPVVITGTGRVMHHMEEPRGMGVAFGSLSAEMQLRVIDAIGWHRTRMASRGAEPGFRTRELTAEELAQLDEDDSSGESITSLSASAVLADESLAAAARSGVGSVSREESRADLTPPRRPPAPPPSPPTSSAPPARKPPPPPPPKDDEYEDF